MGEKKQDLYVYLCVHSYEGNFVDIESALRMNADEILNIGDFQDGSKIVAKVNSCSFFTEKIESIDLNDHIMALMRKFPDEEAFKSLPKDCKVSVNCVAFLFERTAILGISKEAIRFISSIGANLDIDHYC